MSAWAEDIINKGCMMPDAQLKGALEDLSTAYQTLIDAGFKPAQQYRGGDEVDVIELGSTGIHRASRVIVDDEDHGWFAAPDGEPIEPILFRMKDA